MKTRTPQETLKEFKQLNKVAREKRAVKNGFADAASYLTHLETLASAKVPKSVIKTKKTATPPPPAAPAPIAKAKGSRKPKATAIPVLIHVADILDASGSMSGPKFINALKGINKGIEGLKCDKSGADYTYTLCDFSDDTLFPFIKRPLCSVTNYSGETRGSTALWDAIGRTVRNIQKEDWVTGTKVLVNIYTDGQENASREFSQKEIAAMIKVLSEQGWTFTFVGTSTDVAYVTRHLHIDESNTLVYDGSAKGLEKSLSATVTGRARYASAAVAGEDVSRGFYKDLSDNK